MASKIHTNRTLDTAVEDEEDPAGLVQGLVKAGGLLASPSDAAQKIFEAFLAGRGTAAKERRRIANADMLERAEWQVARASKLEKPPFDDSGAPKLAISEAMR